MKIKIALCQINVVDNKEKNIENPPSLILKNTLLNSQTAGLMKLMHIAVILV